jgi:hypothetical protein
MKILSGLRNKKVSTFQIALYEDSEDRTLGRKSNLPYKTISMNPLQIAKKHNTLSQ